MLLLIRNIRVVQLLNCHFILFLSSTQRLVVVIEKDSGYINASKLCVDGGNHLKHWLKNKNTHALINVWIKFMASDFRHDDTANELKDQQAGIPASPSAALKYINGSQNVKDARVIRGTYLHALLIPHVACWISPVFALKVGEIVNSFIVREYKDELAATQEALRGANDETEQLSSGLNYVQGEYTKAVDGWCRTTEELEIACNDLEKEKANLWKWSNSNSFAVLKLNGDMGGKFQF